MKLSEFKEYIINKYGRKEWDYFVDSNVYEIYTSSEEEQIKQVQDNGCYIRYIKEPIEKVKLEAIKQNGYVIQYIENPTKEMQLLAVKDRGNNIKYIKEPSEEVQLEAVKDGYAIQYIKNPSERVLQEALRADRYWYIFILKHLENDLKEEETHS